MITKLVLLALGMMAIALIGVERPAIADDERPNQPFDPSRGLVLRGKVVTMNDTHDVIANGNVLVRNDRIVAIWRGERRPVEAVAADAEVIDLGPSALIFPGMINLHNHPTFDMLRLWPAPSSDVQASIGRPLGTEPYANRYQWNDTQGNTSPEYRRVVETPQLALVAAQGLHLEAEVVKYAAVQALVGGETTTQGALPRPETDGLLARNVESANFGRQRIESRVASIDSLTGPPLAELLARMQNGQTDAWLIHLAEGVRDGDRRPGDPTSSRSEFASLRSKGLLTDMTVIVHGTALEAQDFVEMRGAPTTRSNGSGDGLGAKLVWSPLSNLLLYGHTTNVYQALAAGVLVSLGTDWTPSGSRNLLGELKVADIALRDSALLGASRALMPALSVEGASYEEAQEAERALDRLLVDMVTRNPAETVRWQDEVGSIEPGKIADLFVITEPARAVRAGLPSSPYRSLIDATERDVRLVLVGGIPLVGDLDLIERLKPRHHETIASTCGCYVKAIDVTKPGLPKGDQTLALIQQLLESGLVALGGDNPPAGGGPSATSNTYSYLKNNFTLPFPMTDAQFMQFVLIPTAGTVQGRLNLERLTLSPLLEDEDEFFFDVMGVRTDPAGLFDDPMPPFKLYRSNSNQEQAGVNPFASDVFEDRWYPLRLSEGNASGLESICFLGAATACARR
jgi:5-methylthioadenosine/S-adenosylhomocysteine deaminase